jgi:hypothetical protein
MIFQECALLSSSGHGYHYSDSYIFIAVIFKNNENMLKIQTQKPLYT